MALRGNSGDVEGNVQGEDEYDDEGEGGSKLAVTVRQ